MMTSETSQLSGPERMFRQELEALGATIEAFIFRPPVDWLGDQYGYRITKADGSTKTGLIPWDLSTFSKLIEEVRT